MNEVQLRHQVSIAETRGRRLLFIDNLRWTMIILVISMHAADTYSPLGNWYFVDRTRLPIPELLTFAAWQMYLQSFFMGLLFFIAGIFIPTSFDRKGPRRFVKDRAFRLGLPVLFYMFVLGPVTEYYVAHSWSAANSSFAREWWRHTIDLEFLSESGPLICLALLMATLTFLVRLVQPAGSSFLNVHLGDFSQYILLFSAGVLAGRNRWLLNLSFASGMRWLTVTGMAGFAAWVAILITGGALQGNAKAYSGGWHWQSAAINLWESFTCVGFCFGLLALFRRKFDSQRRLAWFLSDNAFSVYVFHPPVVIVAARALYGVPLNPLLKCIVVTCVGVVVTFAMSGLVFRRIPLLRSIL